MSYKPFPYPVLTSSSTLDPDYLNSQFDLEVGYKSDIGVWLFQVNVSIKNDSILDLLKNNKAKIFCIIKSTGTFFLENFDLNFDSENLIKIKKEDIKGSVELNAVIISNDIQQVVLDDITDDYFETNSFNFEKGDILGVSDSYYLDIHPLFVKDTPIQSDKTWFVDPWDKDYTSYEPRTDGIFIKLPRDDFRIQKDLTKNFKELNSLFKMKYFVPILMDIINEAKDDEQYKYRYPWYEVFEDECGKYDIDLEDPFIASQDIIKKMISGNDTYNLSWVGIENTIEKLKG